MPKPIIRQSGINNYFTYCPHAYALSQNPEVKAKMEANKSDAMIEGLLMEGYVFKKFKEDNEVELIGGKRKPTIDKIKGYADLVIPIFIEGDPFVLMRYEVDNWILQGEADYIGQILFDGQPLRCIADLKFTKNIQETWNNKMYKRDFIQACTYVYLHFKLTGELLPFVYLLVENKYETPLIKYAYFEVKESDFTWIEGLIGEVVHDLFKYPVTTDTTCTKKWGRERCRFLEYCPFGQDFIAGTRKVIFSNLEDDLEYIKEKRKRKQEANENLNDFLDTPDYNNIED